MNESSVNIEGNWLWGSVWVFYAFFYARYFVHLANRQKPDLELVDVQGSPERLLRKAVWSNRFAFFMMVPTVLEFIRPTEFTSTLISVAPCVFGIWVMRAVWSEVFRSKMPKRKPSSVEKRGSKSDIS